MKKIFLKTKNEKGFVMLFTVLVVSIILALAIGIANLSYKQTIISSVGKDSQIAFFAADSGIECGLKYYYQYGVLDLSKGGDPRIDPNIDLKCGSDTLKYTNGIFKYNSKPNESCFDIEFARSEDASPAYDIVRSSGYNICAPGSPRHLERQLEVRLEI